MRQTWTSQTKKLIRDGAVKERDGESEGESEGESDDLCESRNENGGGAFKSDDQVSCVGVMVAA
jgi:hypothetical protein